MPKKSKGLLELELIARKASGDKKSRLRSCLLCQKRKQKCDHRMPLCTTCIKAGVQCIQPEKYSVESPAKDEYTVVLEKRVLYLESMIDDTMRAYSPGAFAKYRKLSPFIEQHDPEELLFGSVPASVTAANPGAVARSDVELSSEKTFSSAPLVRTNTFDPSSDDMSAGLEIPTFSLMNDPMRKIPELGLNTKPVQSSAQNTLPQLSIAGPIDLSATVLGKYDLKEFTSVDPEYDVADSLSRTLIDTHFIRFQFKFPFLNEKEVIEFHHAYTTRNLSGYMNDVNYFYFACCRMWLIYSLNSFILKTTGQYKHLEPLRLFSTALRSLSKCTIVDPFQQIEIYLLTILCLIRCDRDSIELYRIVGDAMKVAVSLGLHKYSSYLGCPDEERIKKMKCFWCVYLLDRLISVSIGKPFTFPEKEIDTDIPLFEDDPSKADFVKDFDNHSRSSNGIAQEHVLFINQTIKLKRIEAKAIESLNIVGSNSEYSTVSELPLVEHYFDQLQNWRKECDVITKDVEKATLGLYYFRTVRVLIQPYLELMQPEDRLLRECQAAAGQICQLFKVFHQRTVFGHSTLAINNVFVAGVTLIYCLWLIRNTEDKRRKLLGDTAKHTRPVMTASLFTSLDDLKACSICLFVMAERSKYAVVFRDTFDQLMRATIGNLIERCGPDSSELVYNHKTSNTYHRNVVAKVNNDTLTETPVQEDSQKKNDAAMPPAVVRRPVSHYEILPNYIFENNKNKKEYNQIQEENKRKRGVLEKSVVPKSLSHLLISNDEEIQKPVENSVQHTQIVEKYEKKQPVDSTLEKNAFTRFSDGQFYGDLFNIGNNKNNDENSKNQGPVASLFKNNGHRMGRSVTSTNINYSNTQDSQFFNSQPVLNSKNLNSGLGDTMNNTPLQKSNSATNDSMFLPESNATNLTLTNNSAIGSMNMNIDQHQIPFTDRANDMINNISTWSEASGPITASYAINNFVPYEFLSKDLAGQVVANQVYADLDVLNNMADAAPPPKKRKFDTKNLFNGKFNQEIASTDKNDFAQTSSSIAPAHSQNMMNNNTLDQSPAPQVKKDPDAPEASVPTWNNTGGNGNSWNNLGSPYYVA